MDHDKETCDCPKHHPPVAVVAPPTLLADATPGQLMRAQINSMDEIVKAFPDNDDFSPPDKGYLRLDLLDHGSWNDKRFLRVTLFVDVGEHFVTEEEINLAMPRLKELGIDDVVLENEEPTEFAVTEL